MKARGCKGFSLWKGSINPAACDALPPYPDNILNLRERMPKCSITPCYNGVFEIGIASIADP